MKLGQDKALRDQRSRHTSGGRSVRTDTRPHDRILELQRLAGNQAVARSLGVTVQREFVLADDVTAAIERLRPRYPNVQEGSHGSLGPEADAFWREHMSDLSLDGLVTQVLGDYLTESEKNKPISVSVQYDRPKLGVRIEEAGNDEGITVIQWFRVNPKGQLEAEIRNVYAPGRGRQVMKQGLLPLFERLGITQVTLTASTSGTRDDGKFVWARYGFVPIPADWERMQEIGREKLTEYSTRDWYSEARADLGSSDPRMLRRLVMLSWRDDDAKRLLNHILSWTFGWKGEIDLGNEVDRAWITSYVNEEDTDAFVELLPDKPSSCCVII